jgi:cell wall assembly regulator SMI1
MALLTIQQARERNQEKALKVLRFLRTSIYSTAELLGEVMGIKARSAIFETLQAMERKHLLRHQMFREFTGSVTLWGITPAGQEACLQDGEEAIAAFFNSAKVSLARLQHYLCLQKVRIRAEAADWRNVIYCDRPSVYKGGDSQNQDTINEDIRPDLLARHPQNRTVAIEYERLLKWTPRYKEHVIPGHIRRLNAGEYAQVIWVCRDQNDEQRLRAIILAAVKQLRDDNQFYLERTSKDYKAFVVTNINSWPNF